MDSAYQGQSWKTPGKESEPESISPPSEEAQWDNLPFWCKQCDLVKMGNDGKLICTGDDANQNSGCHYGIQKHLEALNTRFDKKIKIIEAKLKKLEGKDNG